MPYHWDGIGLAAGFLLDLVFADPRRAHPVAAFGRIAGAFERLIYRDSRTRGLWFALMLLTGAIILGYAISHFIHHTLIRVAVVAIITWAVLGGTSLIKEAETMAKLLVKEDLPAARFQLRSLCGRDASSLGTSDLTRATVESVAENTSDAVVAPLFWGALFGLPGLLAYRALNTLDAMVGHRSARYAKFGMATAKLDDLANFIPSRLTGILAALWAPIVGGDSRESLRVMFRDGRNHPSPNAGQVEAAFAGALDLTLGGSNTYDDAIDERALLGDGQTPEVVDISRANQLSRVVQIAAVILSLVLPAMFWDQV